jgi:hypothetical protein
LGGEGSRHGPVPCAWQPDSADPLRSGQPVWRDPSTRLSSDNKAPWRPACAEDQGRPHSPCASQQTALQHGL